MYCFWLERSWATKPAPSTNGAQKMSIDCSVPRHLMVMRSLTGITETPGSANNPKIMSMRDWIACTYGDMKSYCELYTGDDVAW